MLTLLQVLCLYFPFLVGREREREGENGSVYIYEKIFKFMYDMQDFFVIFLVFNMKEY